MKNHHKDPSTGLDTASPDTGRPAIVGISGFTCTCIAAICRRVFFGAGAQAAEAPTNQLPAGKYLILDCAGGHITVPLEEKVVSDRDSGNTNQIIGGWTLVVCCRRPTVTGAVGAVRAFAHDVVSQLHTLCGEPQTWSTKKKVIEE